MNPWYDELNHKRECTILSTFGTVDDKQNTVFCLFEPTAPGLTADSFPNEESTYFGTRPGRRRIFLDGVNNTPIGEFRAFMREVRKDDTKKELTEYDLKMVEKNVAEFRDVTDAAGLARVMNDLAAKWPAKPGSEQELPVLPVMPDVMQSINMGSADSVAVVVLVSDPEHAAELDGKVHALVFEEGLIGRFYVTRATPEQWAKEKQEGRVQGGSMTSGIAFLAPDPYGLESDVWAEISASATEDQVRSELVSALERFSSEWKKQDRHTHLAEGAQKQICWSEFDPTIGRVAKIEPRKPKPEEVRRAY